MLPTRSERKRGTILDAGRELFLTGGYQGTSVDQIAARAAVSKQTVYKHFGDKQRLLFAIVSNALESAVRSLSERIAVLPDTTDLEADLVELATDYLHAVLQGPVVALRRLVVGEANRLPELAELYYEHAPARTLAGFADAFRRLHERGLLCAPESSTAADHFAFLIVGKPIDEALFRGGPRVLEGIDVDTYVRSGVRAFLAAYRSDGAG
jgi:TetR/AcrR family transcriptional regulator, mexJK operon transcriptional repressor